MIDYKWVFDGIGSSLISLLISSIIGAIGGYKYGVSVKQKQTAGDNSVQIQTSRGISQEKDSNSIKQEQKAGKNAVQVQEADSNHADK